MPSYRPKPVSPRVRAGHPLQSGLLRYFALAERAGNVLTDTAGGAHATLNSASESQRVICPYGRAFNFVGGGNRAGGSAAGLPSGSAPRSVAVLFRTTSGASRNLASWGVIGGGLFNIGVSGGVLTARNESTSVNAGSGLNDGNWHLGVITTGPGSELRFYADGRFVGQRTLTLNTTANGTLYIASYQLDLQTLLGDMAMLAVWGRTLSDSEVAMLTSDPFAVVRPPWRLVHLFAPTPVPPEIQPPRRVRWFPGLRRGR